MLRINGKKYAKNNREALSTLFESDGTFCGFYRVTKNSVMLYDMQQKLFAAVVCNKSGFRGVVNAGKASNGRVFYQYGANDHVNELLGVPAKYGEQAEYAQSILNLAKGN